MRFMKVLVSYSSVRRPADRCMDCQFRANESLDAYTEVNELLYFVGDRFGVGWNNHFEVH